MREGRVLVLSGNRESRREIGAVPAGLLPRHGDAGGDAVHESRLTEDEAWRLIRARAEESHARRTAAERAALSRQSILDHVAAQPCRRSLPS